MFGKNLFVFAILAVYVAAVPTVDYACYPESQGSVAQYYSHESDCGKFYECVNGALKQLSCPAGLHFNDRLDVCDYPENAGCRYNSSIDHKVAAPVVDYVCPPYDEYSDAQYYPHESNCSKFYECGANGKVIAFNCPAGLHWNKVLRVCDYPANAGCKLESLVAYKVAAPVADYVCPPYNQGSNPQYYPHELDCSKFYQCGANGNVIEFNCPAGLHWNEVLHACDYPENAICEK